MNTQTRIRQLRWRSKRGLLELELMLAPFVESDLGTLSPEQLESYARLLECDDLDLYDWLRGHEAVADPSLESIVERIKLSHRV